MNKEKIEKLLNLVGRHGPHNLSADCDVCIEITQLKSELFEDVAKALLFNELQKENIDLIANIAQSRSLISILENETKRDTNVILELRDRIKKLEEELGQFKSVPRVLTTPENHAEIIKENNILKQKLEKIKELQKNPETNLCVCGHTEAEHNGACDHLNSNGIDYCACNKFKEILEEEN